MSGFAELHDELRAVARELLAKEAHDGVRWQQVTDAGWPGLEVPEAVGGSGATFAETAVVLEELGRAATASPFLGSAVLGVAAASAAGDDDVLQAIAAGGRVAVALAPHADALEPVAPFRLDSAGRLTGRAELVVDAATAEHLLVLADAPDGLALVHLPRSGSPDRPRDGHPGGQNDGESGGAVDVVAEPVLDETRSLGSIAADRLAVPGDARWPIGPADAQAVLDRAALAVALDAHGVAAAMLDATVSYAGERRQFGRPIGSFQAVKHQCADVLVALRIGRELLDEAVAAVVAGDDPDAGVAVSRAKAYVTAASVDAVGTAMQLHGGIGYTWESGIHRFLKRALLDRALFAAPAEHRRRIADRTWP